MIEWVVVVQPWRSVTLGSKMGKLNIFHQISSRFIFQYHPRPNINLISLSFSVCPQLDLKMCVSKRMEPLEMLLWSATGQRHNSRDPEHPNTAQLDAEPLSTSSILSRSNYRPFFSHYTDFNPSRPLEGMLHSLLLLFMRRFMVEEMVWIIYMVAFHHFQFIKELLFAFKPLRLQDSTVCISNFLLALSFNEKKLLIKCCWTGMSMKDRTLSN